MMWNYHHRGYSMYDSYGGWWLLALLVVLLLAFAVAVLLALVLRPLRPDATTGPATQTSAPPPPAPRAGSESLEILRRRYAAGDIDEEEFQHRSSVLAASSREP